MHVGVGRACMMQSRLVTVARVVRVAACLHVGVGRVPIMQIMLHWTVLDGLVGCTMFGLC